MAVKPNANRGYLWFIVGNVHVFVVITSGQGLYLKKSVKGWSSVAKGTKGNEEKSRGPWRRGKEKWSGEGEEDFN